MGTSLNAAFTGSGGLATALAMASYRRKQSSASLASLVEELVELQRLLSEGVHCVKHPRVGAPCKRFIYSDDAQTLYCVRNPQERQKYTSSGKTPPVSFKCSDIVKIFRGRSTPVFARTMKYYADDEQDALDQRCMSMVLADRTVDLEFPTVEHRNEMVRALSSALSVPAVTPVKAVDEEYTKGGTGLAGAAYRATYNVYMERFILACIVGNIIIMAIGSPLELEANKTLADVRCVPCAARRVVAAC